MTFADAGGRNRAQLLQGLRRALRRSCQSYARQQQHVGHEDNWYHLALGVIENDFNAFVRLARRARRDRQGAGQRLVDLVFRQCTRRGGAAAVLEADLCALYSLLLPVLIALSQVLHEAPEAAAAATAPLSAPVYLN
jgi:hypothetical protein